MTVVGATPFVFQGFQGSAPCNGEPDQVAGPNIPANNGCYLGGGLNSATFWSTAANAFVPIPHRWAETENNWNQKVVRITTVFDGDGGVPGPATTAADVIDAVNEALTASGMYILIETHNFTGANTAPVGAFNQPTPTTGAADSWARCVTFWDTVINAFQNNGRVWFNFSNEPTTGQGGAAAWQAQAEFWVKRTRLHLGATNIIVLDLDDWGQDLDRLAAGSYDAWWASMAADAGGDLTSNLVLGWHAYGARDGASYTYATMDADLLAVHQKGYPILVGEYGQSAQIGNGVAGPDQWNRDAVDLLVTNTFGPALATKYQLLMCVWHATGDGGFWCSYKLAQGADPANPTGPLAPGVDGYAIPFWDITAAEANSAFLEPLGLKHWNFSQ